ncbi:hypothetical protein Salat_0266200 [Sesamum alatum]|uniref:Late embryogenesis abundant protein LEA-2 subgroup domain-containing protein n=1 Tax=Sesamum alatum TaxID=300844 RepID=A0AAE1Z0I1_9LAMI|nr:hypothetical protein Salat_0266200 [Sesamum alatum]
MSRALKICCFATATLIATLLAAILIIYFTMLKPKQPKITTQQVTLKSFSGLLNPLHLNVTLGIVVTVDNPNYGSFKYDNTTAFISYRGTHAAEASIEEDTIPARGKHDISTDVLVIVDNLVTNYYFPEDYASGCLNFTSLTTLHGQAKVLNFLKIKATTYSTCDISVYVLTQNASSVCRSKLLY